MLWRIRKYQEEDKSLSWCYTFYQRYLLILRWCHKNMTNVSKTFSDVIKSFFQSFFFRIISSLFTYQVHTNLIMMSLHHQRHCYQHDIFFCLPVDVLSFTLLALFVFSNAFKLLVTCSFSFVWHFVDAFEFFVCFVLCSCKTKLFSPSSLSLSLFCQALINIQRPHFHVCMTLRINSFLKPDLSLLLHRFMWDEHVKNK